MPILKSSKILECWHFNRIFLNPSKSAQKSQKNIVIFEGKQLNKSLQIWPKFSDGSDILNLSGIKYILYFLKKLYGIVIYSSSSERMKTEHFYSWTKLGLDNREPKTHFDSRSVSKTHH